MPFTFSHPFIILPLKGLKSNWFSLTGLIVGSIAPDFEYFIKMEGEREYGHTLLGLFWFDLPLAVVLAFVFHAIIKPPLMDNMPGFLKRRFSRFKDFNWYAYFKTNWLIICLSILIGSLSHLFLDSFTNANGYFVQTIPFLSKGIRLPYSAIYASSLLSYALSIIGAFIIIYAIWQLPVEKKMKIHHSIFLYWMIIAFITAIITRVSINHITNDRMKTYWYLYTSGYIIIIMSAFIISLILTSLIFRIVNNSGMR